MAAVVATGGIAVLGCLAVVLARHPALPEYAGIVAIVVAAYAAAAVLARRRSEVLGAIFAVVASVLWMVELWAGNLAAPGPLTLRAYRLSTVGVLVPAAPPAPT